MTRRGGEDIRALLVRSRLALRMNQSDLARLLGVSPRTMRRWISRGTVLSSSQLLTLATAVHAKDPVLAARIVAERRETLEALGVVVAPTALPPPPPPAPPPPEPPPPPPPVPPARAVRAEPFLADAIVCAAAEIADISPRSMRPALAAAFARAHEAGLTLEAAEALFAPAKAPTPAPA